MQTRRYEKFAGVDYSTDAATIDDGRAPHMRNMISNEGGYPEKRPGYRTLHKFDARINGIFALGDKFLIHAGSEAYICSGDDVTLALSGLNDAKSTSVYFREKLYILTGGDFLVFDGEEVKHVRDDAFVPTVLINMELDDKNYVTGGDVYQSFNLLTLKRRVIVKKPKEKTEVRFAVPAVEGSIKVYSGTSGQEFLGYVLNISNFIGTSFAINFNQATNTDTIMVEYELDDPARRDRNRAIIEKCTFAAVYENRLFLGGNPDYPTSDFYCELYDPGYFTDIAYTNIGTRDEAQDEEELNEREKEGESTRLCGYSYIGNYLAIHRDGNGGGASIYLREGVLSDDGMFFPIVEGIVGEPLIAPRAACRFIDDPIFLTKSGVHALQSENIKSKHSVCARSTRINARLTLEENLDEAISCVWRGYLMIFVNGNVYVADSRQKSYSRNISGNYEYEWYFWDNIPARCVCEHEDVLYFGCTDGRFCRLNSDIEGSERYCDDGEPIVAEITTKLDNMGSFMTLKNIVRRGSGVYVKAYPYPSRIEVFATDERGARVKVADVHRGRFNFENVNFASFTFNTSPHEFVSFKRKVKDFRKLSITCRNAEKGEPLGVYAIELRIKPGYFAK